MIPDWLSGLGLLAGLLTVGPAFGWAVWPRLRQRTCRHYAKWPDATFCAGCGRAIVIAPDPAPTGPIINGALPAPED